MNLSQYLAELAEAADQFHKSMEEARQIYRNRMMELVSGILGDDLSNKLEVIIAERSIVE